jgi:hypothetical protein
MKVNLKCGGFFSSWIFCTKNAENLRLHPSFSIVVVTDSDSERLQGHGVCKCLFSKTLVIIMIIRSLSSLL